MSKLFQRTMSIFRFVSVHKQSLPPVREGMAPLPDYMIW